MRSLAAGVAAFVLAAACSDVAEDPKQARKRARQTWNGSYQTPGEKVEPHFHLIYGEGEPLSGEFETLALQVWQPLLDHLIESSA